MTPIRHCGFFVLRTPLLPFDDLEVEGRSSEESAQWLRDLVRRPEVREAIFLASPNLDVAIDGWLEEGDGAHTGGVEAAVLRYALRMAGRPTPFGLFAGCSVGTIGPKTSLEIAGRDSCLRRTRLDTEFLAAVADGVTASRPPGLRVRPNPTLYIFGGQARFVASRWNGKRRTHHLVTVRSSPALTASLARVEGGATIEELATAVAATGTDHSAAARFVDQLIGLGVVLPSAEPVVTGQEPLEALQAALFSIDAKVADRLGAAARTLADIDGAGLGVPPGVYRELAASLTGLSESADASHLFQVDLTKPAPAATIGRAVLADLERSVHLLHRLARPSPDHPVTRFVDEFVRRYGDREVPLLMALDPEVGVGFGASRPASPVLGGLDFPTPPPNPVTWGRREDRLLSLLSRPVAILSEEDLIELSAPEPPPLPPAFDVVATIVACSGEAVDRGDFSLVVDGASGPSGARLLGRFCHADPTLRRYVEEHLRAEEALDPDSVYAEIVHLPERRVGNILHRPVLRAYEITLLGQSGAPADRQITPADLTVAVRQGQVVLASKRLGRQVVPRLTTAHNPHHRSIGLYRFLCALPSQGIAGALRWTWAPLTGAPFLPRVVHGRLILSLARWRVVPAELPSSDPDSICAWRRRLGMPRWVRLVEGDNALPIDLANPAAVAIFIHRVRRLASATVEELLPGPGELCAHGPEGRFAHELVVPFVQTNPSATVHGPPSGHSHAEVRRSFAPGSEWVFAKLYAAPSFADEILREVAQPVAQAADQWFFIRYSDPDPHLRLRGRGDPARIQAALQAAAAPALADGRIWRLQLDTYEREVDRYGGAKGISLCEQVFCADSDACLGIVVRLSPGDRGSRQRWWLALRGMDLLLADLGLEPSARLAVIRRARTSFGREHRVDGRLEQQLSARFRSSRGEVEAVLDPSRDAGSELQPGFRLLTERSSRVRPVGAELAAIRVAEWVAPSLMHMHANRLLRSAHRAQELLLYDTLQRHYTSVLARPGGGRPI